MTAEAVMMVTIEVVTAAMMMMKAMKAAEITTLKTIKQMIMTNTAFNDSRKS